MITIKDRINFINDGASVMRFHARPGIKTETDGHHSHMVVMLCYMLSPLMPSAELLMTAATHDLAEQYSGDVPAPTKWALGLSEQWAGLENKQLEKYGLRFVITGAEARILSMADSLAGMLYCCREAALGNKVVRLVYAKWMRAVSTVVTTEQELEVVQTINQIWEENNGTQGPQFDVFKTAE